MTTDEILIEIKFLKLENQRWSAYTSQRYSGSEDTQDQHPILKTAYIFNQNRILTYWQSVEKTLGLICVKFEKMLGFKTRTTICRIYKNHNWIYK